MTVNNELPFELLMQVEKPARYIGREINMIKKDEADVRFCFCFPDTYEVGMSHLGLQIIYFMLNDINGIACERSFSPWIDFEKILKDNQHSLFSLESFLPLKEFDFLGFTLQYEMSYTNVLQMLDLSNIPFLSQDRNEEHPLVCGGGPCAYNPEPLAEIFDFFYIGEAETLLPIILKRFREHKLGGGTKQDFLEILLEYDGIYVPKFYKTEYFGTKQVSFEPTHKNARRKIRKNIVIDINESYYPEKQLVPLIESVHDRVSLEIFRGCLRGCRFCQAGFICRPVREKKHEKLLELADKILDATGHEEVSLVSLSTGDYSEFKPLVEKFLERYTPKKINMALPSLRIDAFNLEVMSKIQTVRRSSLTFAPEAGTQRMRNVINKNISTEEILAGSKLAFMSGWGRIKLYFMVGLPSETLNDVEGIAFLGEDIVAKYYEIPKDQRSGAPTVIMSASCFVPKPFTPFQWVRQNSSEEFLEKSKLIKRTIKRKQIKFNYHDTGLSVLEGVFARGDRRLGKTLIKAYELGCRFDSWSECYNPQLWNKAFEATNINKEDYTSEKSFDELLPWDFIDIGVSKEYFIKEAQMALNEKTTDDCRTKCSNCGVNSFGGGVCHARV